ncbi:UxaA family hydrolase [Chloroflexota bacterium]
MSFTGYPRSDGSVGTRNLVGIISVVSCANDVVWWLSQKNKGCAVFLHGQGCCQSKPDADITTRTLISLGCHPNLAAVLLVSLGCETVSVDIVAEGIARSGKRVEKTVIQKAGAPAAIKEGSRILKTMLSEAARVKREPFDDSQLILGVKCGASDTTSGLAPNPAVGGACDLLIDKGGMCVFGETTEFIGAEHILARRAANPEVAKKIINIVERMEKRAIDMGFDMRGGQPTAGNIAGGLTTIEEKSLGAIVKGGTRPIQDVYEYGERIQGKGLYIVDSPGREPEFLTAAAATGAQVIVFTTGLGAPQGFPFVPVIKITGNPHTFRKLPDHMDMLIDIPGKGYTGISPASQALYDKILDVASGEKTKAETLQYGNFPNIFTIGPTL